MKDDLIIRFKHIRFKNNHPLGTICVIKSIDEENKNIAIGIAICSLKDNFNKSIGRELSRKRAFKAWHSKRSWLPINQVFDLSVNVFMAALAKDTVFVKYIENFDSDVLYKCFYIQEV